MSKTNTKYRIQTPTIELWVKTAPSEIQLAVRWLHHYASRSDTTLDEIGTKLKQPNGTSYSGDSVYQFLTGRRTPEQCTNIIAAITALEKIERERQTITRAGFVETNLTSKIFKICDAARNFRKVMFIFGPSHIGKTTALREFARRNNSGATIYLRAPAGGGKSRTLTDLCKLLNLPKYGSVVKQEIAILNAIDDTQILIVDEAHQFLTTTTGLKTLEFIREIHDVTGCGIIFSATEVFSKEMQNGEARKWLNQLGQRHLITANLPLKPTKSNLNNFAQHFGLAPATGQALDLQTSIIRVDSLGRWLSIIEGASRIAKRAKTQLAWHHVLSCHAALLDLETI